MLKSSTITLLGLLLFFNSYGQYNREFYKDKYKDGCYKTSTIKSATNHIRFICKDTCIENSFITELKIIDSNKYFRNGLSAYYYDVASKKPKAFIYFINSNVNGFVKEFYPNGKLKYEGLCRTVKYVQPVGSKKIFKIDIKDTVVIKYEGTQTYDSIKQINQYCFVDTITGEGYSETNELLFYSPYYQKQKFGKWKYYDDTGKLIKEEYYEKGKLIRTKTK